MSTSILFRPLSGVPGDVTRPDNTIIEPAVFDPSKPALAFGVPLKLISGKIALIESGDVANSVVGILSRVAPSISGDTLQTLASGTPNPASVQGVVVKGYVNVVCTIGTPVRGNPVYMRVVAASGKAIGDLEATADVAAVGAAGGGNTGNGTMGTLSANQAADVGVYKVTFSAATVFAMTGPLGEQYAPGATGAAYTAGGVTFTITAGGTAFVAGDTFTVTVTKNNVTLNGIVWATNDKDANNTAEVHVQ